MAYNFRDSSIESCLKEKKIYIAYRELQCSILPLTQIISRFNFSKCISFATYLDIIYILMHSKIYMYRKSKRLILIWDGGSR